MISNMKRYKSIISKYSSVIKREISGYYSGGSTLYPDMKLSASLYNLTINGRVGDIRDMGIKIVEDSNGVIYICADLRDLRLHEVPFSKKLITYILSDSFPSFSWMSIENSVLRDDINKYADPSNVGIMDVLSKEEKCERVKATPVYDKIAKGIEDIRYNAKLDVHLKDKEFPKLSDRNLLPILILDFDKDEANFCNDRYASSYRASREKRRITLLTIDNLKSAVSNIPFSKSLLVVDIRHKDVERTSL